MQKLKKLFSNPKTHIIFLMFLIFTTMLFWKPMPWDDGVFGQIFAERIVKEGIIDLSLGGFHGADFFVAIFYFFTRSEWAVYLTDFIFALLMIPMIYLVAKESFDSEKLGVFAAYIYALMPLEYFNSVRGGHQTVHWFLSLLAVYLLFKNKSWNWVVLGWSYLVRPFSIAFAPFWIYKKKYKELVMSFTIPIIYMLAQFKQIGAVLIGNHPELTTQSLVNPKRFIPNIIYTVQNFFSIHNYSPINNVYYSDMIRFSPFITFLAVLGIFYYKEYFKNKKLFWTLISFAAIACAIPCSFYRMDMNYIGFFHLALIFLSLPVIEKYERLLPLIAATSAFGFLYFYLSYGHNFYFPYILFLIPAVVLVMSMGYVIINLDRK